MKRRTVVACVAVLAVAAILGFAQPAQAGWSVRVGIGVGFGWHPCWPAYYHCYYPRYYYGTSVVYVSPAPYTIVYTTPTPVVVQPPVAVQQPVVVQSPGVAAVQAVTPVAVQAPAPAATVQAAPVQAPAQPVAAPAASDQPAFMVDSKTAAYLKQLRAGDDGDRKKAARELKKTNMAVVITALVNAMQKDGYADVRKEAAISLGELLARDAQPALRKAAREDTDSGVRKCALKSAQTIEKAFGIEPQP